MISENISCDTELPADFKSFVKLCLMDPTFPQFVRESQNVIVSLSTDPN